LPNDVTATAATGLLLPANHLLFAANLKRGDQAGSGLAVKEWASRRRIASIAQAK
jgi:hypothetical protein